MKLVQNLEPLTVLDCLTDLFPERFDTYQEISAEGVIRSERTRRLLNAVQTRGPKGLHRMIEAMCRRHQRHLAEPIVSGFFEELLVGKDKIEQNSGARHVVVDCVLARKVMGVVCLCVTHISSGHVLLLASYM